MPPLLLCCDLDRTLLPNGPQPESPGARDAFRELVARDDVTLAFATGRSRALVESVLGEYDLPEPDYVIGDVGTSIHVVEATRWRDLPGWDEVMAADWKDLDRNTITRLLEPIEALTLQEAGKQNRFKISFYAASETDADRLVRDVDRRLEGRGIAWRCVYSVDEANDIALLDVLPAAGGKLNALRFLHRRLGHAEEDVLFAGDSGNDLEVLASSIPAVLVANALREVSRQAVEAARRNNTESRLYLARGGFRGMNGNYAAGIVEGATHFHSRLFAAIAAGAGT